MIEDNRSKKVQIMEVVQDDISEKTTIISDTHVVIKKGETDIHVQ